MQFNATVRVVHPLQFDCIYELTVGLMIFFFVLVIDEISKNKIYHLLVLSEKYVTNFARFAF